MVRFTENNTEGFTAQDIDTLNAALNRLVELGLSDDMNYLSDRLNNAWFEGATVDDLVATVRKSVATYDRSIWG